MACRRFNRDATASSGCASRHSSCTSNVVRWRWKRTQGLGNASGYSVAGAAQVTVYYFTWNNEDSGRPVQAPRPATVSAILAAGGEPIVDSAHQIPASEINEVGFRRGPAHACDVCGEPLEYQGTQFNGDGPQPFRDQVFKCPQGHQVWAFVDPLRQWRRRWAAPQTTAAAR